MVHTAAYEERRVGGGQRRTHRHGPEAQIKTRAAPCISVFYEMGSGALTEYTRKVEFTVCVMLSGSFTSPPRGVQLPHGHHGISSFLVQDEIQVHHEKLGVPD